MTLLDSFMGTFWALALAVIAFLILPALIINVDDIERACNKSAGVRQIHSVTYPPSVSLVVCRDGSVKEVN